MADPDDHTAGERIDDGLTTDAHLDAAIRELDRLRRQRVRPSISDDALSSLEHAPPPDEETEPSHVEVPRLLLAENIDIGSGGPVHLDDDHADLFAPEPAAGVQPALAEQDWLFSAPDAAPALQSGYDAREDKAPESLGIVPESHTGTSTGGRLPPAQNLSWPSPHAERSARLNVYGAAPEELRDRLAERARMPQGLPAEASAAMHVADSGTPAQNEGWFGARRSANPGTEMTPAGNTIEPNAMAGAAAAAAGSATATAAETRRGGSFGVRETMDAVAVPEAETAARKGWFGRRKKSATESEGPRRVEPISIHAEAETTGAKPTEPATAAIIVPPKPVAPQAFASEDSGSETPAAQSADAARIGVLLVNLGTPDAPTPRAVRRYLREFLSDRRVIEKDTFVWQLVFKGIILPLRPRRKARAYKSIWNQEKNESPLKTITRAQAEKLGAALAEAGAGIVVEWAMRYGNPAIGSRIKALMTQGSERILIVPLYPQYSSATTATVCDEAFRVVSRLRNQPSLRIAPPYYADPVYIEAVASSIRAELAKLSFEPEVIVVSYHGMPLEYVQKGDPYLRHCTRTTELLRERLGKSHSQLVMTFQSRFGRAEWLQPYTDQTLRKLAKDGVKSIAVVTPGFAADCLETLEEIAIENANIFKKRGGRNFAFIPCLNDSERGMLVIREIAARELNGWV